MAGVGTVIEQVSKLSFSLHKMTETLNRIEIATEDAFASTAVQEITEKVNHYGASMQNIETQLTNVNTQLGKLDENTKKSTSSASSLEDMFGKAGKIIEKSGIINVFKKTAKESVKYASDLVGAQHVVNSVFGDNSAIDEWSQNMIQRIGLNELAAKQFAGTMGATLRATGISQNDAEAMSMKITELSGDLASFYNLDIKDVFDKVKSGLSGETKDLGALNINISEENLRNYALKQDMQTDFSEMSKAEQTMLRYNYLLFKTQMLENEYGESQGNISRQIGTLQERWKGIAGDLASSVLPILMQGVKLLNSGMDFINENWSLIQPIMLGVIGMIAAYAAIMAIGTGVEFAATTSKAIYAAMTTQCTVATFLETAAQNGLNAAIRSCPITWIILAIIALIAVLVALANWISKTTEITQTGFGIIAGAVGVAAAAIVNILIGLANFIITMFVNLANVTSNFTAGLQLLFVNPLDGIKVMFLSLFDFIVGIVEGAASILDTVFGSSLAEAVAGFRNDIQAEIDTTLEANGIESEIFNAADIKLDGLDYGETWDKASAWGDKFANNWGNIGDTNFDPKNFGVPDTTAEDIAATADNTASLNDSVDISNENLKYLKDVAERDAINRFTTAQIKVNMNNNNNISNGMDLDGVINYLTAGVTEAMGQAAEGVHA